MREIASTDFYSIHVDMAKNRLFITYKGAWMKPAQVPNFVKDHADAIKLLSPGFTALVDVRQMEAMLLSDFIRQAQSDAIQAGIKKAARIYDKPTFIQIQAEHIHKKTGLNSKAFDDVAAAEAWLDEP
ncbi:MAG: hypothetical protein LDL33_09035 [Desulfomonile sp.]|nr:hypothetical protein [Desulfomonile sp.]